MLRPGPRGLKGGDTRVAKGRGYVRQQIKRIEPASIEELRDAGAWLHDLYVVSEARTRGVGRRLVEAAFDAARDLGSKSLMLGVSPRNLSGRALFARLGFRDTMIEMSARTEK